MTRKYRFGTERELSDREWDVLFDAAETQAETQARGRVATSEWLPEPGVFHDLDPLTPTISEDEADRLAGREQ